MYATAKEIWPPTCSTPAVVLALHEDLGRVVPGDPAGARRHLVPEPAGAQFLRRTRVGREAEDVATRRVERRGVSRALPIATSPLSAEQERREGERRQAGGATG